MKKDLTVKKPRLIIILLGWSFMLCSIYISLVIGDFVLARSYLYTVNGEAEEIMKIRKVEEDQKMVEEAKKKNLSPLVSPWMFFTFARKNTGFWEEINKYDLAPLGSLNNEDTYYCNEGYGLVTYKTDRFGFRNDNNIWNDLKDLDTYVIGDSFVEGSCVHQGETITDRLNSLGNNTANLGASGNSPLQYAATLKTFFYLHNPKNIVVIFYMNDNVQDDLNDIYYKLFIKGESSERYFDKGSVDLSREMKTLLRNIKKLVLKETTETVKEKGRVFKVLWLEGRSYITLENIRKAIKSNITSQKKIPFSTKLAIDTLYSLCNKNSNCNPVVVYLPNSTFWAPDPRAKNYELLLKEYVENSGYKLVDLSDKIKKNELDKFAPKGPHYSPKGYSIVAEMINPFLIK